MYQVHSWSWYDLDLWPQGQIYRIYDMALCSGLSFFVLLHSHTLSGTWVYHYGTMCCVHSWTKIMFSPWIWVWQDVFDLWHRHTNFWHMGASPWDNMLCIFLTLVWHWPVASIYGGGGILTEFYSVFILLSHLSHSIYWSFKDHVTLQSDQGTQPFVEKNDIASL